MDMKHVLFTAAVGLGVGFPVAAADDAATVVVKRGGADVTLAEVDARMTEIPPDKRAGFIDSPERIDQMLQQLLLLEQLANEARKEGLDRDPEYLAQLALGEKRLLAQLRLRKLSESAPSIDAEALALERYTVDPKRYASPERVSVRHILLKPGNGNRRDEAETLRQRVLAGESIEKLAREHSDDRGSLAQGGLIADIVPGKTVKPFEDAAFALKQPGDVAPLVETEFGVHVIQLVERKPAQARPFEAIKAQIVAEIENAHRAKLPAEHMDELNSLPLEADEAVVASLRTRYGKVPSATAESN
jgi:peptidyl-prolyl cis-trans isomerase C